MQTKSQDQVDHRKLLRREGDLLWPHLFRLLSTTGLGGAFNIEHAARDHEFWVSARASGDAESVRNELEELFGAICTVEQVVRGDGCCDECYDEYDADLFEVVLITKNWPAEELAKLAPTPRKTT